MTQFRKRAGTKSMIHRMKKPFPDIIAFNAVIGSFILKNPLGGMS